MRRRWPWLAAGSAACLLVAPIAIVVAISFSGDGSLAFPPRSWSWRWYERFLGDPRWRQALASSLLIALGASALSTVVGFLAAFGLVRGGGRGKQALLAIILMPLVVPHIVTAIALYFVSARLDLIGNLAWVATAHAMLGLPVVVLIVSAALQSVDGNLERAALGMGCGPAGVLWRIVVPLAGPGIASAALFAFLASFDELVVALFLAGVRTQTLPVRIWNSLGMEIEPTVAAASAVLVAATLVVLGLDRAIRRWR